MRAWTREGNASACVILAKATRSVSTYLVRYGAAESISTSRKILTSLRRNGPGPSEITVAEHGLMALGMVLETRALLEYLRPGYAKLGVAGHTMVGGHMAAITAAVTLLSVPCAVLATAASASAIYIPGLLSRNVDFETLRS